MNAIVGPNGCGKSNIVDAIRWVVGESSAKQLRGQNMSDVIFNGTTGRKSVGKAAVELTFDNTDSRIVGEYAKFSEISVRREVIREGQSNYYINGVSVRRRDLLDLFLGTGLGPRSYSIIEQGMISQLIEKKPEDLRSHFEEVAGISKYRERRRETENRIRHTQDNLDRLNDVREELVKQLRHLKRQSNAAERYKTLKQEERLINAQIKALQWQALEQKLQEKSETLQTIEIQHEEKVAKQRSLETDIEKYRDLSNEWSDKKDEVQKNFYRLGSDITRYEQQIQYKQEQIRQWEIEYQESHELWEELSIQSTNQTNQINTIKDDIASLTPQKEISLQVEADASRELAAAEERMQNAQSEWENFQAELAHTNKEFEVAKTNKRHYDSQISQLSDRQSKLYDQLAALPIESLTTQIRPLSDKVSSLKLTVDSSHDEINQLSQAILQQRATCQETQTNVSNARGELQKLEAQHASLSAMQTATLQDQQTGIKTWLSDHNLDTKPQLGKTMSVSSGWELAVETLLAHYFDAVCVDRLDDLTPFLDQLEKGQFHAFDTASVPPARLSHARITDVISNCAYIPAWLSSVYIAENQTEAQALKSQLQAHESVITKTGMWLGGNWVRVNKSQNPEDSFLIKEKRLKDLETQISDKQSLFNGLEQALTEAQEKLAALESARDSQQEQYQQAMALLSETRSTLSATQSKLESATQQKAHVEESLQTIAIENDQYQQAMQEAINIITGFEKTQSAQEEQKEILLAKKIECQEQLHQARNTSQFKKQQADEINLRLSSNENQLSVLTQTVTSNQKQLLQLTERREMLQAHLEEAGEPLNELQSSLKNVLDQQITIETSLKTVVSEWENYQEQLRACETEKDKVTKLCTTLKEEQQAIKMSLQEFVVRQSTLKEQITEAQFSLETIIAEMPEDAILSLWEENAARLQSKIERLGPINLAAIDEHKAVEERKTYIDQQFVDLEEALNVLQNAIRKIDRETKHLFRDTYDKINEKFQQIFPKVFGGGQASLHLTDDDLLTTGIVVKAQPPGKRNATIHMLSGGEKTLTAIALMFAMFQLNPAPFCVLDEVDAPLDDLNVGRFCQLVKEMSKDTQFLIISHNKVTIESADHLMGVTMQEAGVSRIVSVDMQAAVEMVEA